MARRPDGRLVFSIGASRSGKSKYVFTQVRKARRLFVWDFSGEYAAQFGLEVVTQRTVVARLARATGPARLAYQPGAIKKGEFDFFCRCAFNWLRQDISTIVIEELAFSTNSVKAVGYWGLIVSQGLKFGPHIYTTVQRAQETDKSVLGNASVINICRPNTIDDARYISKKFGLALSDIPDADCEMLQRHKDRRLIKSKLVFVNNTPALRTIKNFSSTF